MLAVLVVAQSLWGQQSTESNEQQIAQQSVHQSELVFRGESLPLRDVAPTPVVKRNKRDLLKMERRARVPNFEYNVPMPINNRDALPENGDPLRASLRTTSTTVDVEPLLNFEGMDEENLLFVSVPDVNGDVSPDYYFETANSSEGGYYQIFDKDGNAVTEVSTMGDLWTQFNITGLGDPVVVWDQDAERWLLTELGFDFATMLIAVSTTEDPMGSWFVYEFQSPWGLPDYPKYGLGPDAYYCTTNEYITGGDMDNHIPVYIFERDKMLEGDPNAGVQIVGIPKFSESGVFVFQVATPANTEGSMFYPAESGHPVVRMYDDAWDGGFDKVEVWEVHVDWDDEGNTYIDGPVELPTAPFDTDLCSGNIFDCITQGDGSSLSALQQVVMNRVTYRNFGVYEAIVMCFSVDVNPAENQAGVRWMELRREPGGEWTLHQEGTIAPDDDHRFMPTIGIDGGGNIALGYSVTGDDSFLSLRYTGRRSSDPLGEMTVTEFESATGLSYHDAFSRWGDYFSMSVDPVDQTTFWFAGQYAKENNLWTTKITTFQIRRDTNDVGPFKLETPLNSGYLTNAETVSVVYKNFGYAPQANFEVGYEFENSFVETKMITDTLQPDSTVLVVFDNTVDMEEIKAYQFKLFTGLAGDENILNDTLRIEVKKLTRWDAGVTDFPGMGEGIICDTAMMTDIVFSNLGVEPLTSVTIYWQFNGGVVNSIDWTGNLPAGESDTVSVLLDPLANGVNTLLAYTDNPSGMVDEDQENDQLERQFQASTDGRTITLVLETDFFPNETTWDLEDQSGNVLYSGGPYSQQAQFEESWCLPLGCYVFKLYDSFGDGLFSGGYEIVDNDGTVLAEIINPAFGFQETNEFCVEFQCMLAASTDVVVESAPGAADGVIIITTSNGSGPFEYLLNGQNPQDFPIFSDLTAGEYSIAVIDANGCVAEVDVEVPVCTFAYTITSEDASSPSSADGSISIDMGSGNPPYQYSLDGETFQDSPVFEGLLTGNYTVTIMDVYGCEQMVEVVVGALSDVVETAYGHAIRLYPNPTEGYFRIDVEGLTASGFVYFDVLDGAGKVVQRARLAPFDNMYTGRITIANHPDGVYFVRFHHELLTQALQVVKRG